MSEPSNRGPLWEAASVPSGAAVRCAAVACTGATGLASVAALIAGWRWGLSVLLGSGVVTIVLVASTAALVATVRRVAPPVALLVAVGLYLAVIVGLLVVAVTGRAAAGGDRLRPAGVAGGALLILAVWTGTLVWLHLRAARPVGPVSAAGEQPQIRP